MSRYIILNTNYIYNGDNPIETPFKWCIYDNYEHDIAAYCMTKKQAKQNIKGYKED